MPLLLFGLISLLIVNRNSGLSYSDSEQLSFPQATSVGAWIWEQPRSFSNSEVNDFLSFAKSENINTIYINIEEYLNILETSSNVARDTLELNNSISFILSEADTFNISIHALAGGNNWTLEDYRYVPKKLLEFVIDYNKIHQGRPLFKGFQFDIEYYNQKDFGRRKTQYHIEYLDLVKELLEIKNAYDNNFEIGFAVPFWFDNENRSVPAFSYGGKKKAIVYHLIDLLDTSQKGYIVVMAYRNYASGSDGSIIHSKNEVDYASKYKPGVSVYVGQETTYVEPSKITFYGMDKNSLKAKAIEIAKAFANKQSFKGFAIHTLSGYKDLR